MICRTPSVGITFVIHIAQDCNSIVDSDTVEMRIFRATYLLFLRGDKQLEPMAS